MCIQECFGCLVIQLYYLLALPKAVVGGAIGGAVHAVACVLVAIVYIPNDIWFTYRCFTQTKAVGPNLRALILLMLPIPLLCWPIMAAIAGFFAGAGYGGGPLLVGGQDETCRAPKLKDWLTLPWSGAAYAVESVIESIKEFVRFNANSYFVYLEEVRYHPGPPFDISIPRLLASLAVAVMGGLIGLIGACLEEPKMPVLLLRGWYELAKAFLESSCGNKILTFIPWCLGMALMPVGVALCMVLMPVLCLCAAFGTAGLRGYQSPTISGMAMAGLVDAWNMMHALEAFLDQATGIICCPIFPTKLHTNDGKYPDIPPPTHDPYGRVLPQDPTVVDVYLGMSPGPDGADRVQLSIDPAPDHNQKGMDVPVVTDVESCSGAKGVADVGVHKVDVGGVSRAEKLNLAAGCESNAEMGHIQIIVKKDDGC